MVGLYDETCIHTALKDPVSLYGIGFLLCVYLLTVWNCRNEVNIVAIIQLFKR